MRTGGVGYHEARAGVVAAVQAGTKDEMPPAMPATMPAASLVPAYPAPSAAPLASPAASTPLRPCAGRRAGHHVDFGQRGKIYGVQPIRTY
jgi:hypothetical protein